MDEIRKHLFAGVMLMVVLCFARRANAQAVLEAYVRQGIANNLSLKQLNEDYDKSIWALTEAKRRYGPSFDLAGQYTRTIRNGIDIPESLQAMLGDATLNNIKDGKLYFPAPNQYLGGLQVTQTIYNAQLKYNTQLQEANSGIAKAKEEDFRISLAADIRTAYYQYLEALQIRKANEDGLVIAQKNLTYIGDLITQHKATKDVLYKAKATVSNVQQAINNADHNILQAKYYFNFLLNVSLDDSVRVDSSLLFTEGIYTAVKVDGDSAGYQYNLTYLSKQKEAASAQMQLVDAEKKPSVQFSGFGGIRGQEIGFDNGQLPLAQLQVSAKWNLFNNGTRKAKYKQAEIQQQQATDQYNLQQQQLWMNDAVAYNDVATQLKNYTAVQDAYTNADVYYKAVQQKFNLGTASILELTDAENSLIQASAQKQVWFYDLLIKSAAYEKATGKPLIIQH